MQLYCIFYLCPTFIDVHFDGWNCWLTWCFSRLSHVLEVLLHCNPNINWDVFSASGSLYSSSFLACNSGLRGTIRRHHPPQKAVLSQICCFWSIRWWCFRFCWMVLSHVMLGRPSCLLQSARGEANRIFLASALSSMHIICPNKVSRRDWITAVSLGCFVSLRGQHLAL